MTRPYSMDLRERVVRHVVAGASGRSVVALFAVSPSFVVKLSQAAKPGAGVERWRRSRKVAIEPLGGNRAAPGLAVSHTSIPPLEDHHLCRRAAPGRADRALRSSIARSTAQRRDLNPIELLFAKLKALLRKAAERSIGALWSRIGTLLHQFAADECRHYLAHAGYV